MPKEPKAGIDIGQCPFCEGKLGVTIDENGKHDGVVHSVPFCKKFEELSADDFIHEAANEAATQLGKSLNV